jgi:predicted transcriptional regulator
MEAMWTLDDATVRDVVELLNASAAEPRAYTTVMTVMHRLDRKGLVSRRRDGKADVYRPRASRTAYRRAKAEAEMEALIERYGDAAYLAMARRIGPRRRAA